MAFLSIIVPIYNADKYLVECLESIVNQTYKDYELILVNDGSTDKSLEICQKYAEMHNNITIVSKANGGLISARKAGLARASGEYIGWVDADDCIELDMFEKMCGDIVRTNADMAICDIYSWNGERPTPLVQTIREGGIYDKDKLEKKFYPYMLYSGRFYSFGILPAHFNKVTRKSIIEKNLIKLDDGISIGEDAACTYFSMLDAKVIVYLKGEYLYKYRTNPNSMCFTWKNDKISSAAKLLNYMYNRILEYKNIKLIEEFMYYSICIYTNVYFEYAAYSISNKQKVEFINGEIELNSLLENTIVEKLIKKQIKIPFDRKLIMDVILCGKVNRKYIAQLVLKFRCLLMVIYRTLVQR